MVTQQQKQYKILLICEVCQDIYVFGNVDRLNPEAPVPVLKKIDKELSKKLWQPFTEGDLDKITGKVYICFNFKFIRLFILIYCFKKVIFFILKYMT